MVSIKFGKSEEEKLIERRSRISKWKSDIDRAIRQYERNRDSNIQNAKIAIKDNNLPKAKLFGNNIMSLESAIKGLKDYKLFLENIDLNLQFSKTTKDIWASLKQGSEDLVKSQLSEKQMAQMQTSIDRIVTASDQIQERLSGQLDQISTAVYQRGEINPESVDSILEKLSGESGGQKTEKEKEAKSPEDQKIDDILKGLMKE
ncbi:Snf7 family protein [Oxyplasma meridianum]|uniref:Snf7 family protein n=1 Tax=Oxyplasma meridianum TaxID=3073602 RepID=A0AAX4NGW3_9ARCH